MTSPAHLLLEKVGNCFKHRNANANSIADGQEDKDAEYLVPSQREETETQDCKIRWKHFGSKLKLG